MITSLELKNMHIKSLTFEELRETQGGLLFLLVPLVTNALVLGTMAIAGAALYARFEAGYKDACGSH